jgi:four helix bundle protein
MEIFELTRKFPKEELYSLTSQIVRSSRSISSNITEGWAKRKYENKFKLHLIDALGSTSETQNWCLFARDCKYISIDQYDVLTEKLDVLGKKITTLHKNWKSKSVDQ